MLLIYIYYICIHIYLRYLVCLFCRKEIKETQEECDFVVKKKKETFYLNIIERYRLKLFKNIDPHKSMNLPVPNFATTLFHAGKI